MSTTTASRSTPPKVATSDLRFRRRRGRMQDDAGAGDLGIGGHADAAAARAASMALHHLRLRLGAIGIAGRWWRAPRSRCRPSSRRTHRACRPRAARVPVPGSSSANAAEASPSGSSEMPNGRVKPSGVYAARSASRSSAATSPRSSCSRCRVESSAMRARAFGARRRDVAVVDDELDARERAGLVAACPRTRGRSRAAGRARRCRRRTPARGSSGRRTA